MKNRGKIVSKQKKESEIITFLILLRRQDSNVRPPGYEPGELPTAPHRDIINSHKLAKNSFPNCECKGTTFFDNHQTFLAKSYYINSILTFNPDLGENLREKGRLL